MFIFSVLGYFHFGYTCLSLRYTLTLPQRRVIMISSLVHAFDTRLLETNLNPVNKVSHELCIDVYIKYHADAYIDIAYGSQIVIKHDGSPGGYLHSHKDQFTGGSKRK